MSAWPDPHLTALLSLAIGVAAVMPSAEAAPAAALEWRVARRNWLRALEHLGFSEEQVRGLAAEFQAEAFRQLLETREPAGSA